MPLRRFTSRLLKACLPVVGILTGCSDTKLSDQELSKLYAEPLPQSKSSLNIYQLGHSLVGRTMPLMLQQIAPEGHTFASQLGWGSTLQSHWEPDVPVNGFEQENTHDQYKDVMQAIEKGDLDAFVMTEMVEIKDAIKYFDSAKYVQNFTEKVKKHNPLARVYVYESWHHVNDQAGWINRLDNDYSQYWISQIVDKAQKKMGFSNAVYIIPVGQVMSHFFKALESRGGVEGMQKPEDIFLTNEDGTLDTIHVNSAGLYLVALVHYAVLYQTSPEGLPYELTDEHGKIVGAPSKETADLMQEITWQVVSNDYRTGVVGFPNN